MRLTLPRRVSFAAAPRAAGRALGFTLVELLVVITIIGVLIGLLLPAVQNAREAGRRTQCKNNLYQLSRGVLQHAEKLNRFPTGGWGSSYAGNPVLGNGPRQHGGWTYNVLPYMEQENLWALGTTGSVTAGQAQRIATVVPFLNCPTRRPARLYPVVNPPKHQYSPGVFFIDAGPTPLAARSDYAANAGHDICKHDGSPQFTPPNQSPTHASTIAWADADNLPAATKNKLTGISFHRSMIRPAHVLRGMTYCYLVGEKTLGARNYTNGQDNSDEECAYSGFSSDNFRSASVAPRPDLGPDDPGSTSANECAFGSNHPYGFNMAFCDGSVKVIKYGISIDVHRRLANRKNEEVIDDSQF